MTKDDSDADKAFGSSQMNNGQLKTLVIGDIGKWTRQGNSLPDVEGLQFVDLVDVTESLLTSFEPDLVLSPLMQQDYDAVEIAGKLAEIGYVGRYRAVAESIPNPQIVVAEISRIAPGVDFDLIGLPDVPLGS